MRPLMSVAVGEHARVAAGVFREPLPVEPADLPGNGLLRLAPTQRSGIPQGLEIGVGVRLTVEGDAAAVNRAADGLWRLQRVGAQAERHLRSRSGFGAESNL